MVHPFAYLFLSYAAIAGSIAFVPPTSARLFAFGGVLICAIIGVMYMDRRASAQILMFCGICQCGVVIYANYFLILMKATPPPTSSGSSVKRLVWAFHVVSNPRGIGTSWQVRNLPAFSKDPNYVPSRRHFILRRIATGLIFYAVLKLYKRIEAEVYYANLRDGDYSEHKESIIRRMGEASIHELFVRAWLPLSFFFTAWCRHQYLHSFVSAFAVFALGDEPRRWPPLYGDIRDAYSVRKFWGSFWQSLLRVAFIANASFIAETLFRIRKGSSLYRIAVTLLTFCISGIMHACGVLGINPKCDIRPTLRWYVLMGMAVIVEDMLSRIYWWMMRRGEQGNRSSGAWKILGYVWVWIVLSWSLPKLMFPMIDCNPVRT